MHARSPGPGLPPTPANIDVDGPKDTSLMIRGRKIHPDNDDPDNRGPEVKKRWPLYLHVFHKCTRVVRGRHALRTRRDTGGALPSDRSVSNNATQPTCTGVSARQRGTAGKRSPSGAASLRQLHAAARRDPREQFTKPARGILVNANGLFSKTPKRFSKRTHKKDLIGSGARSPFSKKRQRCL